MSEAGMEAWRKQTQEMSPTVEVTEERVMTAADTNEVEFEHYSKMMDLTGDIYEKIRKEENREIDMNDIMSVFPFEFTNAQKRVVDLFEMVKIPNAKNRLKIGYFFIYYFCY